LVLKCNGVARRVAAGSSVLARQLAQPEGPLQEGVAPSERSGAAHVQGQL